MGRESENVLYSFHTIVHESNVVRSHHMTDGNATG